MFNFNSILSVVATLIMLISCSSIDATNEKPNNISYFHIVNTPAYITIDSEFNDQVISRDYGIKSIDFHFCSKGGKASALPPARFWG